MLSCGEKLEVRNWNLLRYEDALSKQKTLVNERLAGRTGDSLVFVEHPAVVTIGRSGNNGDLCVPEEVLRKMGVELFYTDRGGRATFHGPGQMVVYPIIKLKQPDLHWYVHTLLESLAFVIRMYGLNPVEKKGFPGLWVNGGKIASIGISVKRWVTYHGIALNVNLDLNTFNWIIPCGNPDEKITSMRKELGRSVNLQNILALFEKKFQGFFAT